jgi:hypothetical protein
MALSRVWESSLLKRRKLAGTGPAGLGAMSTTFLPSSCGADGDGMTWQQQTTRPGPVGSMLQRFETPTASRGSSGHELLRRPLIQKSGPRPSEFRSIKSRYRGAFGAGFLVGWTANGTHPEFQVVTGVSTGALIAPFAYLGPRYDDVLRNVVLASAAIPGAFSPVMIDVEVRARLTRRRTWMGAHPMRNDGNGRRRRLQFDYVASMTARHFRLRTRVRSSTSVSRNCTGPSLEIAR